MVTPSRRERPHPGSNLFIIIIAILSNTETPNDIRMNWWGSFPMSGVGDDAGVVKLTCEGTPQLLPGPVIDSALWNTSCKPAPQK